MFKIKNFATTDALTRLRLIFDCIQKIILLPLLFVISSAAVADSDRLSVFGYMLGQPLNLPVCDKSKSGYLVESSTPCLYVSIASQSDFRNGVYGLQFPRNDVPTVVGQRAGVLIYDGILERVAFSTPGISSKERVRSVLMSKYGTPTSSSYEAVIWDLPDVKVDYIHDESGCCNVRIETPRAHTDRLRIQEERLKGTRKL